MRGLVVLARSCPRSLGAAAQTGGNVCRLVNVRFVADTSRRRTLRAVFRRTSVLPLVTESVAHTFRISSGSENGNESGRDWG